MIFQASAEKVSYMKTTDAYVKTCTSSTLAVISYLTIIGWLAIYFGPARYRNQLVAFHLRQSLLLHVCLLLVNATSIFQLWTFYPVLPAILLNLILLVLWYQGLRGAVHCREESLPILGEPAQQWFRHI